MNTHDLFFLAIETHSKKKLSQAIEQGLDLESPINGLNLIEHVIYMYLRSDRFLEMTTSLIKAGAKCSNKALELILLDDINGLDSYLKDEPSLVHQRYTFKAPFLKLQNISLLHLCSEFNLVEAAKTLLAHGANVNDISEIEENGLGGQTPIFHTINQLNNICFPMLKLLIENGADLNHHVKGLIWGEGMEWETYCPEVNPISYSMLGNLQVFGRDPHDVKRCTELMQSKKYGETYSIPNIPNEYRVRRDKMIKDHILSHIKSDSKPEEVLKALKW